MNAASQNTNEVKPVEEKPRHCFDQRTKAWEVSGQTTFHKHTHVAGVLVLKGSQRSGSMF